RAQCSYAVSVMGYGQRWFGWSALCTLALSAACSGKTTGGSGAAGVSGADSSATAGEPPTGAAAGSDSAGAPSSGGTPSAGAPSSGGTASAGAPSAGGTANAGAPSAGSGGASAGGGAPSTAGTSSGGTGGLPPLPEPSEVLKVKPSAGCGQDPMQASATFVKYTIQTSGTKGADAADSTKGSWSYARDYYVWLPPTYDKQKAYPLVLQGPGCGGYPLVVCLVAGNGHASNDDTVNPGFATFFTSLEAP
ncbi:MAG TPA: hypothetical protein VGL19_10020, partial [Polyangiaceae bacterium]